MKTMPAAYNSGERATLRYAKIRQSRTSCLPPDVRRENMKHKNKNLLETKICIVGLGPAGIGAALTFWKHSLAKDLICIDAGHLNTRVCPVLFDQECKKVEPCQVISGFGGCSLFGSKMSLFPAGSGLTNILGSKEIAKGKIEKAFKLLSHYLPLCGMEITKIDTEKSKKFFGRLGFKYKHYDVYLYNPTELESMYHDLLLHLKSNGVRILTKTFLIDINLEKDQFIVQTKQAEKDFVIYTKYLVLGVGRLGFSLLRVLNSKFDLGGKETHLEVGVRIEFPTNLYPHIDKYHKDLKLLFDGARTYCLCKNGKVALYNIDGVCFTEGYFAPELTTDLTNVGILVRLRPSSHNEKILYEIKKRVLKLTKGKPGVQTLTEYLGRDLSSHKSTVPLKTSISYWEKVGVDQLFPSSISEKIKSAVDYFVTKIFPQDCWGDIIVFAPEVHYSGLSFPIKPDFSVVPGMYLIGECTGRFRGVLQAFTSGMICAESIIGEENGEKIQ